MVMLEGAANDVIPADDEPTPLETLVDIDEAFDTAHGDFRPAVTGGETASVVAPAVAVTGGDGPVGGETSGGDSSCAGACPCACACEGGRGLRCCTTFSIRDGSDVCSAS